MNGLLKRQRTFDCRLVALMTNRGPSLSAGRSCKVALRKRCFRYAAAISSATFFQGRSLPFSIAQTSIVVLAIALIGSTTIGPRWVATFAASKVKNFQFSASVPAVIEPPETLDTLASC